MKTIFIVSDGTGARGQHLLRAALAQFPTDLTVDILVRARVRSPEQLEDVIDQASATDSILVHTLATTDLRELLHSRASERGIPSVDLFGHLLGFLGDFLGTLPEGVPGGMERPADRKMVDALTFAVKHDDGLGLKDIRRADIVLVGVSRTSKTPLSVYLAVRGYRVMNVPIVPDLSLPSELFDVDQKKVVGLRVEPERLRQLREKRLRKYGTEATKTYISLDEIRREVAHADETFGWANWPVVDMTDRALEEAAIDVVRATVDSHS